MYCGNAQLIISPGKLRKINSQSFIIYMSVDRLFSQILCVKGVEFEPFPTGLSLPPKAGPHAVILLGIPHSAGQLRITG